MEAARRSEERTGGRTFLARMRTGELGAWRHGVAERVYRCAERERESDAKKTRQRLIRAGTAES